MLGLAIVRARLRLRQRLRHDQIDVLRLTLEVHVNSRPIEKITDVTDVREICKFRLIAVILSVYFYPVTECWLC